VLGEAEVLGQLRAALMSAQRSGSARPFLSRVFHAALRLGGRARHQTGIGAGALSIASAAVRLLAAEGRDLSRLTVLVLGPAQRASRPRDT
jgi:glutamyl-tRNA reductase